MKQQFVYYFYEIFKYIYLVKVPYTCLVLLKIYFIVYYVEVDQLLYQDFVIK